MKKKIIEVLVAIFSFLFRNRKIKTKPNETVKVNFGCGMEVAEGWYNVDASPTALLGSKHFDFINKFLYKISGTSKHYTFEKYSNIIKKIGLNFHDLRRGLPFKNNSVDIIYHSHFLEHLYKKDARDFLSECFRILKPGGLMRIAVPDLAIVIEMFKTGDKDSILESYFFKPYEYIFSNHKYMYDFEMIQKELSKLGLKEIKKREYASGECPDAKLLDVGTFETLYVECRK
jgi:predicted SAM-dependent methyltransferase